MAYTSFGFFSVACVTVLISTTARQCAIRSIGHLKTSLESQWAKLDGLTMSGIEDVGLVLYI